jgi:uncharacterized lipoprotein YddW (UPF0748 family)
VKKIIILILSISFILCSCSNSEISENKTTIQPFIEEEKSDYIKGVWIAYYELQKMIGNLNEAEFKKKASSSFKKLYDMGFNTVCVQVRAFADAFYNSSYFPVSKYCFGKEGSELKYDVLEILCSAAKENNLMIEAWINPYRVSFDNNPQNLSDKNPAKIWLNDKKKNSNVYVCDSGIYFNPASSEVNNLIINGVKEIAENYDISGIHFDDYFYPSKDEKIDSLEYKNYKDKGGKLSLSDYRRECVNNMIKGVNKAIKDINKSIEFGISPASNIENNYNNLFADVESWAGDNSFGDYICPQVYFGFKNVYQPFMFTVKKWVEISNKKLYIGLALYKAGEEDKYAAQNDKTAINEFKNNKNIIARQINYLAKIDNIKGFYIFSYSSLFDEKKKNEVDNLIKAIQSTHPN